jgi:hypothetical protein
LKHDDTAAFRPTELMTCRIAVPNRCAGVE